MRMAHVQRRQLRNTFSGKKDRMNDAKLKENIFYLIKEEQIKLGYKKEAIRLYYPLQSLNRLLDTELDENGMKSVLESFAEGMKAEVGEIRISCEKGRFCFFLSDSFSEYVYLHTEQSGFLYDFIAAISKHNVSVEEIADQFRKYSSKVCVEKMEQGDFDYVIYFEDGQPDGFLYCLKNEDGHMTYHRFTVEDYKELI